MAHELMGNMEYGPSNESIPGAKRNREFSAYLSVRGASTQGPAFLLLSHNRKKANGAKGEREGYTNKGLSN